MIELCELDRDNWTTFAGMELPEHQRGYVASNVMTIAESRFHEHHQVYGVCAGDVPVGLVAFCRDEELRRGDYWIFRLMIAPEHQGKGFGTQAFAAVVEKIIGLGAARVLTMCKPDNRIAYAMYLKAGFQESGILDDGDTLLSLELDATGQ